MKTYWLQAKESRAPISRISEAKPSEKLVDPLSFSKEFLQEAGRVVVYSPITFQDVARRSIASSPIKTLGRGKLNSSKHREIQLSVITL